MRSSIKNTQEYEVPVLKISTHNSYINHTKLIICDELNLKVLIKNFKFKLNNIMLSYSTNLFTTCIYMHRIGGGGTTKS